MTPMKIDEVVRDIHTLDADLENYERKYGVLSETFTKPTARARNRRTTPGWWIGAIGRGLMKSGCIVVSNSSRSLGEWRVSGRHQTLLIGGSK